MSEKGNTYGNLCLRKHGSIKLIEDRRYTWSIRFSLFTTSVELWDIEAVLLLCLKALLCWFVSAQFLISSLYDVIFLGWDFCVISCATTRGDVHTPLAS